MNQNTSCSLLVSGLHFGDHGGCPASSREAFRGEKRHRWSRHARSPARCAARGRTSDPATHPNSNSPQTRTAPGRMRKSQPPPSQAEAAATSTTQRFSRASRVAQKNEIHHKNQELAVKPTPAERSKSRGFRKVDGSGGEDIKVKMVKKKKDAQRRGPGFTSADALFIVATSRAQASNCTSSLCRRGRPNNSEHDRVHHSPPDQAVRDSLNLLRPLASRVPRPRDVGRKTGPGKRHGLRRFCVRDGPFPASWKQKRMTLIPKITPGPLPSPSFAGKGAWMGHDLA